MSGDPNPTGNVRFPQAMATAASLSKIAGVGQNIGFGQIARRIQKHEIPSAVRSGHARVLERLRFPIVLLIG
jgi:hypothetical protein